MLALDTASFTLTHEGDGSTQLFLGIDLKQVKDQVDMPDKFRINVEAVSSLPRSFVEVDIVAVRDQAYMTDIIHRDKWLLIELSALPFNFADL